MKRRSFFGALAALVSAPFVRASAADVGLKVEIGRVRDYGHLRDVIVRREGTAIPAPAQLYRVIVMTDTGLRSIEVPAPLEWTVHSWRPVCTIGAGEKVLGTRVEVASCH